MLLPEANRYVIISNATNYVYTTVLLYLLHVTVRAISFKGVT